MEKIPEKAILSYAQLQLPGVEFKIETHHGDYYLMLVVDCAKFDKNSDKFDESYRNMLYKERPKNTEIWIQRPIGKIENVTKEIQKFFGVQLRASFTFKNYDYLDLIVKKIEMAISKSSHPEVEFSFGGDGDSPLLKAEFFSWPTEFRGDKTNIKDYIIELEEIMNGQVMIEDNYSWRFTKNKK